MHQDPNWPHAGAWLRGELSPASPRGCLAVVGAPLCRGSITPGRCDLAPGAVRQALDRFSPYDVENGRDLCDLRVRDLGDLDIAQLGPAEAFEPVRDAVAHALRDATAVIILGGDNSVTRPACRALGPDCSLITFDAHFDLRDLDAGLTNGNPVRALLRDGVPGERIVQIGIQSFANSKEYAAVAARAGITVITSEEVHTRGIEAAVQRALARLPAGPIYVNCDIDVLDSAFVPAAPGSRPGGLMPWQLRRALRICAEDARVVATDLVEIDPEKDISARTGLAAAVCMLSFASGVHERCSRLRDVHRS